MQHPDHWTVGPDGLRRGLQPRPVPITPNTIPALIAQLSGDEPLLIDRDGTLSRDAVRQLVETAAAALVDAGIRVGDRVAASAASGNPLIIAFLAVQRIGAIWVGLNTSMTGDELRAILADCGARLMLADDAVADRLTDGPAPGPEMIWRFASDWPARLAAAAGKRAPDYSPDPLAPAAIAYTSGTTGLPKGAVHTNHSIMTFVWGGLTSGLGGHWMPGLRRSVTIPLTILNGMNFGPLTAMAGGGAYVSMDRIDSLGVAEWIERARIEMLGSTPTTIVDIVTRPEMAGIDLSSLRFAFTGGAAGSATLRTAFRDRVGSELCEVYGMTESQSGVTSSTVDCPPEPGGVGRALPHIELRALDAAGQVLPPGETGELCLRAVGQGPWAGVYTGFLGYWNKPEETEKTFAGGWLHTGDMGTVDAAGNVAIVGRKKDMIIRGGANIYPAEVERVLAGHPDVLEAVIAGLPDDRLGEIVAAWVRPRPTAADGQALVTALDGLCREKLSRYKVPVRWFVVDDFPRNAMNKVLKDRLPGMTGQEILPA